MDPSFTSSTSSYIYSEDGSVATFKQSGPTCEDIECEKEDYLRFPACALPPFEKGFITVEFTLHQYGWFGLVNEMVHPRGFPGYVAGSWMVNNNSYVSDDKEKHDIQHGIVESRPITCTIDVERSEFLVLQGERTWKYSPKTKIFGKSFRFAFSMERGSVTVHDIKYQSPFTKGVLAPLLAEIDFNRIIQRKKSKIEEVKERAKKIREEFEAAGLGPKEIDLSMKLLEDRREEMENDLGKFRFLQQHAKKEMNQ